MNELKTPCICSVTDSDSRIVCRCLCANAWIFFTSHHFSALAMCSCASLIFCAAMALGFADEEDTDRPEDEDEDGLLRRLSWFSSTARPRHGVFLREPEWDAAMHHSTSTIHTASFLLYSYIYLSISRIYLLILLLIYFFTDLKCVIFIQFNY